jgi:hypothetical protein
LQQAAQEQLLKWKLKPIVAKGVPIQAEAGLTFRFETTLAANAAQAAMPAGVFREIVALLRRFRAGSNTPDIWLALRAQQVDATPSNQLIRQYFP